MYIFRRVHHRHSFFRRRAETPSGKPQTGNWHILHCLVFNFCLSLLMKRSNDQQEGLKVYCLSTFFFPKLQSGDGHFAGHAAVKKWTKTVDFFLYDLVLVPLHLGLHWALATIQCYASMGQRHGDICHILLKYLMEEYKIKKSCIMEASRWTTGQMRTNCALSPHGDIVIRLNPGGGG
ncbi:sentrin-specific protease 2-like isoform X2 [Myxocyprinus asiaticus]|uniref:sentrin-specific protease 2-like isoform X2 n=1 Tax=Myxocyprinus asiaticus TaxID=70543 RepID=UPI002223CB73|nr:sentrin-specific protease 2-like isoform X2 [Myxocyprinus asiaticus]